MDIETYKGFNLHVDLPKDVIINGRSNSELMNSINTSGDVHYHPCREAYPDESVQRGDVHFFQDWDEGAVYPDTNRDISVYIPKQIKEDVGCNMIIFQDGLWYLDKTGPVRAGMVLDTLIHRKLIPPTIGVFVMPGRPEGASSPRLGEIPDYSSRIQRSIEYDSCDSLYGRFLVQEIIPFVKHSLSLNISDDPSKTMLVGISAGGICSFNAAWHWPDRFGNVLSHCGSFTNVRGAHNYPYLVRSTQKKEIKVFLQSGELDANIIYGNWALANKQMASALEFAGYQYRFEFGQSGHSLNHGGSLFAESIRWLWPNK